MRRRNLSKVIREYANRHNIKVVKTVRRNGFSIDDVYRQFEIMANMIRKHQIDGVIVTRSWVLSKDDELIYSLIGKIKNAGGSFVTTTEGRVGGKAKCKKIEEYIAVLAEERLCM